MIDEQVTFEKFGYYSTDLKTKSHKPIWFICNKCKSSKSIIKSNYNGDLCKSCIMSKRHQLPKPKFISEQNRFIFNTGIDRIETVKRFGYDPRDLKYGSGKKIWIICKNCGKGRSTPNQYYRDLCKNCSNKENGKLKSGKLNHQYGKPIPFKQRIKMSCSHQGINIKDFNNFTHDHPYCEKFNNQLKEQIRNKYDQKCFICGKSKEENGRKLSVHHIDRDKNQGCDGKKWSLVPLCISCHSQSHNKLWSARLEYLI